MIEQDEHGIVHRRWVNGSFVVRFDVRFRYLSGTPPHYSRPYGIVSLACCFLGLVDVGIDGFRLFHRLVVRFPSTSCVFVQRLPPRPSSMGYRHV